jgi:hypothetical protein
MRLSRPKNRTFGLSAALVVLGLLGKFGGFALTAPFAFWLVLLGYILLALGNLSKGF